MSSVNVLPSAPQYGETEPIYPTLPTADDFRLKKSLICRENWKASLTSTGKSLKNTNVRVSLSTVKLLAYVSFPRVYLPQHWQQHCLGLESLKVHHLLLWQLYLGFHQQLLLRQ